MNVVLTGGAGFLGASVLKKLLNKNFKVLLILRKNTNCWRINSLLGSCKIIYSDIEKLHQFQQEIIDFKPDALIHTAWIGVTNNKRNDLSQVSDNIECTIKLFNILQIAKVKTIIGIGSQAEYGPVNHQINEYHLTAPSTLYGAAKLACFHTLQVLCQQNNIRLVWHRLFSSYGPRDNSSWFIPYLINQLINNQEPNLTAGEQLWDYIYIDDAAEAVILSLVYSHARGIYNLGSGGVISIRDLAEKIKNKINSDLKLGLGLVPYRSDQVMHLQADITKLKLDLNWSPEISLEFGLEQTIEWFSHYESINN